VLDDVPNVVEWQYFDFHDFSLQLLADEVFQARLVNGNLALLDSGDFLFVIIDTNDLMTDLREAGPRYQADVS
jgi:hypothetical protein